MTLEITYAYNYIIKIFSVGPFCSMTNDHTNTDNNNSNNNDDNILKY